jgi:hypothetical protein
MNVAIALGCQTKDEREKHKADGPFFFTGQDENLATWCRWQGRHAAASAN